MHRWLVGDVEIVRVEDLDFALPSTVPVPAWSVPHFAPSEGEVGLAFSALAIDADGTKIVVDPWLANDGPRELGDAAAHAERLLAELAGAGFAADEVEIVVNTHLDGIGWNTRPDGVGWKPSFPNARYLYPADEVAALDRGAAHYGHEAFAALRELVNVERVEAPAQLTPSVSLVPAPGHNDGHVAVRVESCGELALYTGHLVLSLFQVANPDDGTSDGLQAADAIATRRRLLTELARREGILLTTLLGGPGGGTVRSEGQGFRLEPAHR